MQKPLKILAVGNSFSVDAMQYLAQIAADLGTPMLLGNLYIGGCSLQRHYDNALIGAPEYVYYKTADGNWQETPDATLDHGLGDEDWDIITMQQASHYAGAPETFTCLPLLIEHIRTRVPDARLLWHMTWAYQSDSSHKHFPRYGCDQAAMYAAVVDCLGRFVDPTDAFADVIPVGTAIQNCRSGFLGDTLTRDGFHLSYTVGRLLAAMTWYATITGCSADAFDALTFNPAPDEITPDVLALLKASVAHAIACPRAVTPSAPRKESAGHLEIERKWLIAYPDTALLAAQPGATFSHITQTYLTASDGISRRVRARVAGGITTYTRTTKRRISATTADEDEAIITADEYAALLREADPTCRPIEKIRWCIPHGAFVLEIDLYPFWQKQAVLEIELPSPDIPVELPAWITVLREVTGEKGYSNHALARAIPAE